MACMGQRTFHTHTHTHTTYKYSMTLQYMTFVLIDSNNLPLYLHMVGDIQVVQSVGNLAVDTTCQLLLLCSQPTNVPRKPWKENKLCYTYCCALSQLMSHVNPEKRISYVAHKAVTYTPPSSQTRQQYVSCNVIGPSIIILVILSPIISMFNNEILTVVSDLLSPLPNNCYQFWW